MTLPALILRTVFPQPIVVAPIPTNTFSSRIS